MADSSATHKDKEKNTNKSLYLRKEFFLSPPAQLHGSCLFPFHWPRRKYFLSPQPNRKGSSNLFALKWAIVALVSFIGTASAAMTKIMQTVRDIHSFIASELTYLS